VDSLTLFAREPLHARAPWEEGGGAAPAVTGGVDKVIFVGSVAVGQAVMRAAAEGGPSRGEGGGRDGDTPPTDEMIYLKLN